MFSDGYYYVFSKGVSKRHEVRFRYRGHDLDLIGCEAADLKLSQDSVFKVTGTAVRREYGCRLVPIRRIFYGSWVGFLRDWVMEKNAA